MFPGKKREIEKKKLQKYLESKGYIMLQDRTFPDLFFWKQ
jgi:hypothetical protein